MDLMNFEIENWDAVPVDEEQKAHWREILAKAAAAKVRKEELEEVIGRLEAQKVKTQANLERLEGTLSQKIHLWAEGKKNHKVIDEHREKVFEERTLLADVEVGLELLQKDLVHETRNPIAHGVSIKDQIRYLLEKESTKRTNEANG